MEISKGNHNRKATEDGRRVGIEVLHDFALLVDAVCDGPD
jgi:hypothetical protein